MFSVLLTIVVYLAVMAILYALIEYLIPRIPIPDPMANIIRIVMTVVFALLAIALLLSLIGVADMPLPRFR